MAPSKLSVFLALSAASPSCDAFAFTPSNRLQQQKVVKLSASKQSDDNNDVDDVLRKVAGGAAAFMTGMGIMAQVALADPSTVAPIGGEFS